MSFFTALDKSTDIWTQLRARPRLACAIFLVFFALPFVVFFANLTNHNHFGEQAYRDAGKLTQGIGERIGVINTTIDTLSRLQVVQAALKDEMLVSAINSTSHNASYIRNVGQYRILTHDQRDTFESQLSHNGYSDFSIARIQDNGRFTQRSKQDLYFPVSAAGPPRTTPSGFLGVDLASHPQMAKQLMQLKETGANALVTLPFVWPLKADLMILQPNAAINSSMSAQDESGEHSDLPAAGGSWLAIDMARLFSTLSPVATQFDISAQLESGGLSEDIYARSGQERSKLLFSSWYEKSHVESVWNISPNTRLVVVFEQTNGISITSALATVMLALLILLISCLYTRSVIRQQNNERQHHEGLQDLFHEREKAEKTLNSVQDSIITLNPELTIIHINPSAVLQFNTTASMVVGKHLSALSEFCRVDGNGELLNVQAILATINHNVKKDIDVVPAGSPDDDFVLRMSLSSSYDYANVLTGHVLVLRDISHERRLSRKLAYQANYDALTGCTNRHFFEQSLERLLGEMPGTELNHTLCYMDLDQFKVINDTCGHRAGDQLLIELTKNLKLLIRDQDVLSRLGGDEFGLILVGLDKHEAGAIADRLYQFFQNFSFTHQGNAFSITASIGVVHIDTLCATSKDIMAAADIACYAAKDSGRNSMSVYSKSDENMTERSEELSWLPRLQTALQNNEFRLHAQAVATLDPDSDDLPVEHFEFLLRLTDKSGTEMTPWQFIQAAERYDLMRDIDRWVISNALRLVSEQDGGRGSDCSFSINLSGQSAADPTLKTFIQEQIKHHGVDPAKIWFELTETAAISHFSVAIDLINNIRSTGAKVALDDFGSGLSSFGYLKNLPVDVIKIDGQFVKEIATNSIDREMVRAIHRVGEAMNIVTVAEFVEDQETVDELRRIGVNYAQGYFIGKPTPVSQAIAALGHSDKAA